MAFIAGSFLWVYFLGTLTCARDDHTRLRKSGGRVSRKVATKTETSLK